MGQRDYFFSKLEDAVDFATNKGLTVYLDFYEPSIQMLTEREIARFPQCDCVHFGGQEYSERKMLAIFPASSLPDNASFPIACVQIKTKRIELTHSDVLGALMGLGIEREKVGDINICDDLIQIFVCESLGEFVVNNLNKIGRHEVSPIQVELSEVQEIQPVFVVADLIVASMRLDAIVHTVFKLSRSEASGYVKGEKVKVNHVPTLKPAATLKQGDIVSVRSKGRFIVDEQLGTTKKGNIKLRIKKFS